MSETKAEQRLNAIAAYIHPPYGTSENMDVQDARALLIGADALRLWREYLHERDAYSYGSIQRLVEIRDEARALLTRAQEEPHGHTKR